MHDWCPRFYGCCSGGVPFYLLTLEVKGTCNPGFHGIIMIRETIFGKLPLIEHCTDIRLKHALSFCGRGLFV